MEEFDKLHIILSRHFSFSNLGGGRGVYRFDIDDILSDFDEIRRDFQSSGYHIFLREMDGKRSGILFKMKSATRIQNRPYIHLLLLIVTFATTTWAGYYQSVSLVEMGFMKNIWVGAFSFSLGLMLILGSHEMGHKLMATRNGVDATYPYFIPMPPFIFPLGTMGAVIRIKSPTPDRNSAIELGVSGPLAGVIVSIPVLLIGLRLSYPVDTSTLAKGGAFITFGEPLLYKLVEGLFRIPRGHDLLIHPLGFAGWVGLFVTSLNLIPVGQLDGGHIARAILGGRYYRWASFAVIGILAALGAFYWYGWFVWAAIGTFMTIAGHPGSLNELKPIERRSWALAGVALLILVLCIMPKPISIQL
ncbi:MAG: site-2 protease family protein [bacterium]